MSTNMEYALSGKIIQRGKGSAAIALTADMCQRFGVKVGSRVDYYYDGKRLILTFPEEGAPVDLESAAPPESF